MQRLHVDASEANTDKKPERRGSVAQDGVKGVTTGFAGVADQLGVAAEQIFNVTQKHIKSNKLSYKVRRCCQIVERVITWTASDLTI